jgi:branched-chain amino acid transport system permease protein
MPFSAAPGTPKILRTLADAAVAAAVAGVLGLPLLGFRLVDEAAGERVETRFPWLAALMLAVFLGRLALRPAALGLRRMQAGAASFATGLRPAGWVLNWGLAGFALVLPALPFTTRRTLDVGVLILTYVMLGWGLNIVTGLAGLLDLGYIAFVAVGAYSYAILNTELGISFWACLPLAALFAATAGMLLGIPVLRLRGDYFAIVTLGFGEIMRIVANNWRGLTNGSQGIAGIAHPSFFGIADFRASPLPGRPAFQDLFGVPFSPLQRIVFLYYLILALALLVNLFTLRIRRLPIGRAWEALREDETAAEALGIDRRKTKLAAFAVGAAWGGIGGVFLVARQSFVSPENFQFMESAMVTAIVVLGGMGSQLGIVLAALALVGLPELFREFAEYRMLAFGAAMILIMRFRPRGLIATRRPSAVLGTAPGAGG